MLAGYEGLKKDENAIPPQGKINIPNAIQRLVELYDATGKKDEAKQWQAERAKYPKSPAKLPEKK